MAILKPFSFSSMYGAPFSDYLNVTTPLENEQSLRDSVVPLLESLGPIEATPDGSFRLSTLSKSGLSPSGVVKIKPRGKVLVVSASGAALGLMRRVGAFSEYLSILSDLPHRVSMLHATADFLCASTSDAVMAVKSLAIAGDVSLTRKRILPSHVRSLLQVNSDGSETGTIYLGNRANADVWAKVYDKREEQLSRGFPDPGPLVRVEIAVQSDVGATLRDAYDPSALFWHFAGRSLVAPPDDVQPWLAHGEGYVMVPRVQRSAYDRMHNVLAFSQDLRKLVAYAQEAYGDKAAAVLSREISKLCEAVPMGS